MQRWYTVGQLTEDGWQPVDMQTTDLGNAATMLAARQSGDPEGAYAVVFVDRPSWQPLAEG